MADEFPDDSIIEVVGTGAKTYSILTLKGVKKRLKGIKKYVVDKEITHEDYLNCVLQNKQYYHEQNTILAKRNEMYTQTMKKKSLDSFDDKIFITRDNIHTYPWGFGPLKVHQQRMKALIPEIEAEVRRRRGESMDVD